MQTDRRGSTVAAPLRVRACITSVAAVFGIVSLGQTANAQGFLGKIAQAAGSVVSTGVKIATVPTQALINTGNVIVGGGNPSDIYKPYQDLAKSAGQALGQSTDVLTAPEKFMYKNAQDFAGQAGPAGDFIFDLGTFTNRYMSQLATSGLQASANVLQGQNVFQIAAAPLAAALRAAHDRYASNAQPIPADVRAGLAPFLPASTLARAKFTVGRVEITLPNFIGQGNKLFGTDYAVVVDDIIVFNTQPPSFQTGAWWWGHEVTHVSQYEHDGYEGFAYRYVADLGHSIEGEADQNGTRVAGGGPMRPTISGAQVVGGPSAQTLRSFDMTGAPDRTDYQANPEFYVAQCVFPADPYPVQYLVTNYGRIIAVEPATGRWMHLGFATPPLLQGVAWTYWTPNLNYAVMPNGAIAMLRPVFAPNGQPIGQQWVQVGYVIRLR